MKKSKIIVPAVALLVLGMAAATSATVAWYTANDNATAKSAASVGNLTSTESSITAGEYVINFTITPADSQLELSHVADASDVSSGLNGIDSLTAGDLVYGVISNGTPTMRKCGSATNFISGYTVTAAWASAPTDPADVAYLTGKQFDVALGVSGNAKLLSTNNVTGQSNATAGTVHFTIAYSAGTWSFNAGAYSHGFVHIEPTSLSASETDTVGAVTIAANQDLALS